MFRIKELRQKRADQVAKMKALLDDVASVDAKGNLKPEKQAEFEELELELKAISANIERVERVMDAERALQPAGSTLEVPDNVRVAVGREGFEADTKSGGFKDHRDFFGAVMKAGQTGRIDKRLMPFQATQGSDEQGVYSDPHGGFLVPSTIAPGVLTVTAEDDPLKPLVTDIPMRTPMVTFNARVDKNHATSVSGGLTVSRRPETVDGTPSRMKFEPIQMNAHELFGMAYATESILQDSPESFIALLQAGFRDEFAASAINERLNGTGVGEFAGVLNADCLVTVSKETGQVAATIVTENIDKMSARCWKYRQAVWIANQTVKPQLAALVRAVGTGGAPVPYYRPAEGEGGNDTLYGRPVFYTEHAKALGTKGDLILGNWTQYLEGTYQPLQQAESIHVRFAANERAFKFWLRNDGQPWWKSALTPKNGDTLSPFVALQTRS